MALKRPLPCTGQDIRSLPETSGRQRAVQGTAIFDLPAGWGATRLTRPGTWRMKPAAQAGISAADNKYPVENGTGSC